MPRAELTEFFRKAATPIACLLAQRALEVDVVVGERVEVETGGGESLLGGPRVGVGGGAPPPLLRSAA